MNPLVEIFQKHPHWSAVQDVCSKLEAKGHEAWLAGGCVRDALLGRVSQDFDVATSASPEQVEEIFANAVAVGKAFGVMIIPFGDCQIEVATFRKDGLYVDGRRPTGVTYSTPKEDAERRDFTVNALFFDLKRQQVVDYVGGVEDLKAKVIRTVGRAQDRFSEDHLRLMRAVRFSAQLDFKIEFETLNAISSLAPKIKTVSKERIRDEFYKLMKGRAPTRGLNLLKETGLFSQILPELEAEHSQIVARFRLIEIQKPNLEGENLEIFYWVSLFLDSHLSKAQIETKLEDFKLSRHVIRSVLQILDEMPRLPQASKAGLLRTRASGVGDVLYEVSLVLRQAAPEYSKYLELPKTELPARWVRGDDLAKMGFKPGPQMGALLEEVYDMQLEGKLNSQKAALEWARHRRDK